ncbi:U1 protein [Tibrovirus congo]|uniref:U1 protein n=1 Tax=Tibrovirus congo TaxID=1987017 RepID=K0A2T3_9RHAB|nr:U1 protein [Tibrovirus congo]AFS65338.1 U1 protein [Tibrovirus congo]
MQHEKNYTKDQNPDHRKTSTGITPRRATMAFHPMLCRLELSVSAAPPASPIDATLLRSLITSVLNSSWVDLGGNTANEKVLCAIGLIEAFCRERVIPPTSNSFNTSVTYHIMVEDLDPDDLGNIQLINKPLLSLEGDLKVLGSYQLTFQTIPGHSEPRSMTDNGIYHSDSPFFQIALGHALLGTGKIYDHITRALRVAPITIAPEKRKEPLSSYMV